MDTFWGMIVIILAYAIMLGIIVYPDIAYDYDYSIIENFVNNRKRPRARSEADIPEYLKRRKQTDDFDFDFDDVSDIISDPGTILSENKEKTD